MTHTLKATLNTAYKSLKPHSDSPRLDAEILITFALKKQRSFLYSHADYLLSKAESDSVQSLVEKRRQGMPVAYLTGHKEFWSLNLKVTPDTLIPRPDSEILVQQALVLIQKIISPVVFDLGTGSGALAIAIAKERPDAKVLATDISKEALYIAKENACEHQVKNITFIQSNWFKQLENRKAHLIVSNPPYIAKDCPDLESNVYAFEPHQALISADNGLADIRSLCQDSLQHLETSGHLLLEFGHLQSAQVQSLMQQEQYQGIVCYKDLQHKIRAISGMRPDACNN